MNLIKIVTLSHPIQTTPLPQRFFSLMVLHLTTTIELPLTVIIVGVEADAQVVVTEVARPVGTSLEVARSVAYNANPFQIIPNPHGLLASIPQIKSIRLPLGCCQAQRCLVNLVLLPLQLMDRHHHQPILIIIFLWPAQCTWSCSGLCPASTAPSAYCTPRDVQCYVVRCSRQ